MQEEQGVIVPKEIVKSSMDKQKRHRSFRQTEVYRDVCNLKYLIVKIMGDGPKKYAKYYDEILIAVCSAKRSLASALESGDEESRNDNLDFSKLMIEDIVDDTVILYQLGVISKDKRKTIKKLAQKIAGQEVRLRDYFNNQGIGVVGKTM